MGGPLGGWLNDTFGWYVRPSPSTRLVLSLPRQAIRFPLSGEAGGRDQVRFSNLIQYQQMPILLFSFVLVTAKVNIVLPDEIQQQSLHAKLRRIDYFGSFTLVGAVGCLLLGFSLKSTEELPWSSPIIWGLLLTSVVWGTLFVLVETHWSPYPVMPMRLVKQRTPLAVSLACFFGSMAAFSTVCLTFNLPMLIWLTWAYAAVQCTFGKLTIEMDSAVQLTATVLLGCEA